MTQEIWVLKSIYTNEETGKVIFNDHFECRMDFLDNCVISIKYMVYHLIGDYYIALIFCKKLQG